MLPAAGAAEQTGRDVAAPSFRGRGVIRAVS